jgi:hypothetical protein
MGKQRRSAESREMKQGMLGKRRIFRVRVPHKINLHLVKLIYGVRDSTAG